MSDVLPSESQRKILDILLVACADAYRLTEEDLRSTSKAADVCDARRLFCTLGRAMALKDNGRPAQLELLAAYVCRKYPTVLYTVEQGNKILRGEKVDKKGHARFRDEAATLVRDLEQSNLIGEAVLDGTKWKLPRPHPVATSIIQEHLRPALFGARVEDGRVEFAYRTA